MKKVVLGLVVLFLSVYYSFSNNTESEDKSYIVGEVFINNENTVATGAEVALKGVGIKTVTNADGSFRLSNIPAGSYELEVKISNAEAIQLGTLEIKKDRPYSVKCFVMY